MRNRIARRLQGFLDLVTLASAYNLATGANYENLGNDKHLTVVKLTCNENGGPTYSSWYASTQSQEDYHGPHNHMLPQ